METQFKLQTSSDVSLAVCLEVRFPNQRYGKAKSRRVGFWLLTKVRRAFTAVPERQKTNSSAHIVNFWIGFTVWFEPTDVFRASKPFLRKHVPAPTFISPNFMEFRKIFETVHPESLHEENISQVEECLKKGYLLAELIDNIIITLGKSGVIVIRRGGASDPFFGTAGGRKLVQTGGPVSHRIYKPRVLGSEEVVNASGAGDCFAGGFISAMLKGKSEKDCIESGFNCATASLKCPDPVPKTF